MTDSVDEHPWRKRLVLAREFASGETVEFPHGLGDDDAVTPLYVLDRFGGQVAIGPAAASTFTLDTEHLLIAMDTNDLSRSILTLPRSFQSGERFTVAFAKGIVGPTEYPSNVTSACTLRMALTDLQSASISYSVSTVPLYLFDDFSYGGLDDFTNSWQLAGPSDGLSQVQFHGDHIRMFENLNGQVILESKTLIAEAHTYAMLRGEGVISDPAYGGFVMSLGGYQGELVWYTTGPGTYSLREQVGLPSESGRWCLRLYGSDQGEYFDVYSIFFDLLPGQAIHPFDLQSELAVLGEGAIPLCRRPITQPLSGALTIPPATWSQSPTNATGDALLTLRSKLSTMGGDSWPHQLTHSLLFDPELTYAPTGALDLAALGLSAMSESSNLVVIASVQNAGSEAVQHYTVAFYSGDPEGESLLIGSVLVTNNLVPGATNNSSLAWTPVSGTTTSAIYAVVDPYDAIEEDDEDNNTVSTESVAPDLMLAGIEYLWDMGGEVYAPYTHPIHDTDVKLRVTVMNAGGAPASNAVVELFAGADTSGGPPVDSASVTLGASSNQTVLLDWHPTAAGVYGVTAVVDRDNQIVELAETNNSLTSPVLVSIDREYIDCGSPSDTAYGAAEGFGYLGGVPRTDWGSGAVSTALETARYDLSGEVRYRFDHTDPYYPYQVDLSLYRGDSVTSSYEVVLGGSTVPVYIAGMESVNELVLSGSNSFIAYATAYVPPSSIVSNTLFVTVRRTDGPGPACLSEIQVAQGNRTYIDCGAPDDHPHDPTNRPYGHLSDGYAWFPGGATPVTSVRYDFDSDVRYRLSDLDPAKRYVIFVTLWEGDGVGRSERIVVDGSVVSDPIAMGDGQEHVVVALVSSNDVADGQLDVTVERVNGGDVQVSIIEMSEWTQDVLALQDMDSDGMPDGYEVAHGEGSGGAPPLDPAVNDAGGDADGDGVSNLGEFLCGTDPLDASSVLKIVGLAMASGDGVTLSWDAAKLKHYRIDRCVDLRTGTWEVVSGDLQATDDGVMNWDHPAGAASPKGFYRVVLVTE